MYTTDNRLFPLAARTLKVVGIVMILASLVDFIIILIPVGLPDQPTAVDITRWQLGAVSQLVDRGIVPLVGLALLFSGLWLDNTVTSADPPRKIWQTVGVLALVLSSLLGLIFLLALPLHLNNLRVANNQTVEQIGKEAAQAEGQLGNRLTGEVKRQRDQINFLIGDEQRFKQALQSGQLQGEQATLLQRFKENPKALDDYLQTQSKQFQDQIQTQIRTRKLAAEKQAKTEAIRGGVRTGISSLLLAIAYIVIGWTGLREIGGGRPKIPTEV